MVIRHWQDTAKHFKGYEQDTTTSFEIRQAYKQFIAGVVGLVDKEVPSEEFGVVALTIYCLFGEKKKKIISTVLLKTSPILFQDNVQASQRKSPFDDLIGSGEGTNSLPQGTQRKHFKGYEEIEIKELDDFTQAAFRRFKTLNRIQSRIFYTAYNTNENILVCAPTGARKTNIAMISILHEACSTGLSDMDVSIEAEAKVFPMASHGNFLSFVSFPLPLPLPLLVKLNKKDDFVGTSLIFGEPKGTPRTNWSLVYPGEFLRQSGWKRLAHARTTRTGRDWKTAQCEDTCTAKRKRLCDSTTSCVACRSDWHARLKDD
ncbi:DExH-box ATP-dependent RNA helicase DExH14 [Cucumis melo var. makuwa]|uniref:DExH-box ATP-dependent RNA helicase DExH14 n=1 Tax=Cucumis melo var. makuwa TaxID=1194695 RepID=A0A5A7U844_CUCMM|nr:DExH-box ATP-dependent RNA helicase DExH14 [Cucumis melo var. makuwa]